MNPKFSTAKLVMGIFAIIISVVLTLGGCLGSCAAALASDVGTAAVGIMLAGIFMLAGGIVSVAERNSTRLGENVACIILFFLAGYMFYSTARTNEASSVMSAIWCAWPAIFSIFHIITIISGNYEK